MTRNCPVFGVHLTSPFMIILLLGFQSIRNTLWAFFVLIPFAYNMGLMSEEKRIPKSSNGAKRAVNLMVVATLCCFTISLTPYFKSKVSFLLPPRKRPVFDNSAPIDFAKYLSRTPDKDPVLNDWEYGSFLALTQPHPYFIDTRNIVFSSSDFETYINVMNALQVGKLFLIVIRSGTFFLTNCCGRK
jgi:hypothetical protein